MSGNRSQAARHEISALTSAAAEALLLWLGEPAVKGSNEPVSLALALVPSVQPPPPSPVEAASQAAVQDFTEACVQGQFRLSPERGQILSKAEEVPFADVLSTWPQMQHMTVKLNYPPQTYLVFAHYGHLQSHSIASECVLVSGSITKHDAMATLMATAPGIDPIITYIPIMYLPEWTIDQPKKGFRSRMNIREGSSIILDVGMYNISDQKSGTKHQ